MWYGDFPNSCYEVFILFWIYFSSQFLLISVQPLYFVTKRNVFFSEYSTVCQSRSDLRVQGKNRLKSGPKWALRGWWLEPFTPHTNTPHSLWSSGHSHCLCHWGLMWPRITSMSVVPSVFPSEGLKSLVGWSSIRRAMEMVWKLKHKPPKIGYIRRMDLKSWLFYEWEG